MHIPKFFLQSLFLTCIFSASGSLITAKGQSVSFGSFSPQELAIKECSFDKGAEAVIIYDKGVSNFNEEYNLITLRNTRFKILKESGIERANIRIPFYSNDGFEFISNIEAVVITENADGSVVKSNLEKKNIFTKKVNRLYSEVSFALPNVKVGSIIEYRYTSHMKNYAGLKDWEFQSELPVMFSSYNLAPIPNSEFAYSVYKKHYFPINIKPNNSGGTILFEMSNIPGLRDEAYITSPRKYLQRVIFQFSSFKSYYGTKKYTNTWKELANELINEKNFGGQVTKSLSKNAEIKSLLEDSLAAYNKMLSIHNYVKSNFVWDDIYSKYAENSLRDVVEKRKGNSGEINLLLVNLLKSAGLDAFPLLVSERSNGSVDTSYPYIDQFNKVVAYVNVDGSAYVLDGTDYQTPSFLLPFNLSNTVGFIVDKKKFGLVILANTKQKQSNVVAIQGVINENGIINASAVVSNHHYSKIPNEARYKRDKAKYREDFFQPHLFLKAESFEVQGTDADSAALKHDVKYSYDLKKAGGYHLLQYNLFTGFNKNPFISDNRFSDIDFGVKYATTLAADFTLPSNLIIESLPKNKKLITPDRSMSVSRELQKVDNRVSILVRINFDRIRYTPEEYDMVRDFYKELLDLLNEPILLKDK